jgi:hypothetical protein
MYIFRIHLDNLTSSTYGTLKLILFVQLEF